MAGVTHMLFHTLTLAILIQTPAAGDEILACTSGSSCPAWKDMVGSSSGTKVAIPQSVTSTTENGESDWYEIVVTPGNGAAAIHAFHRYSHFLTLHNTLSDGLEFPPKLWLNSVLKLFGSWHSAFETRRAKLEEWLQAILNKEESKDAAWADAIFKFLDCSNLATKSGIRMPPSLNKICGNNAHYFGINVTVEEGADPFTIWHRFSEFYKLSESLGAKEGEFSATPLPPKIFSQALGVPISEETIHERRQGLEKWLQAVSMHPDYGKTEKVKTFLDLEVNKKAMEWNCMFSHIKAVAGDKLEEVYKEGKGKVNEFSDKFQETELFNQMQELHNNMKGKWGEFSSNVRESENYKTIMGKWNEFKAKFGDSELKSDMQGDIDKLSSEFGDKNSDEL